MLLCVQHLCRGCFDIGGDDEGVTSPSCRGTSQLDSEQQILTKLSPGLVDLETGRNEVENSGRSSSLPRHMISGSKKFFSGSLIPDNALSPKKPTGEGDK